MKKFKFMLHSSLRQLLRKVLLRIAQNDYDNARNTSHTFDLIKYAETFSRTRWKRYTPNYDAPQFPEFNNVDYDPEKLMYVYNTAVDAYKKN